MVRIYTTSAGRSARWKVDAFVLEPLSVTTKSEFLAWIESRLSHLDEEDRCPRELQDTRWYTQIREEASFHIGTLELVEAFGVLGPTPSGHELTLDQAHAAHIRSLVRQTLLRVKRALTPVSFEDVDTKETYAHWIDTKLAQLAADDQEKPAVTGDQYYHIFGEAEAVAVALGLVEVVEALGPSPPAYFLGGNETALAGLRQLVRTRLQRARPLLSVAPTQGDQNSPGDVALSDATMADANAKRAYLQSLGALNTVVRGWMSGPTSEKPADLVPLISEHWSPPMSKTEMARRITNRSSARPRDVETILEQYGIRNVEGNRWTVRLDKMDAATRKRLEAPV